jgi:hypothetical protein
MKESLSLTDRERARTKCGAERGPVAGRPNALWREHRHDANPRRLRRAEGGSQSARDAADAGAVGLVWCHRFAAPRLVAA